MSRITFEQWAKEFNLKDKVQHSFYEKNFRACWDAAVNDCTWKNIELREKVARAMHRHHCMTTNIYNREGEIETSWAASAENRKLWHEKARTALEAVEEYLKERN